MDHGLSEKTVATIHGILAGFPEVEGAVLFGSRAKGCHREGSDIDLTLLGDQVTRKVLTHIEFAFDDSMLPYRFSLSAKHMLSDADFIAHIERVGVKFYSKA